MDRSVASYSKATATKFVPPMRTVAAKTASINASARRMAARA